MNPEQVSRARTAAVWIGSGLGLRVDDTTVLQNANKLGLRLLPCDLFARVAEDDYRPQAEFEVDLAGRLVAAGSPVAAPAPNLASHVHLHDGFVVTLWTYYESLMAMSSVTDHLGTPVMPTDLSPEAYAEALMRLHAGMRQVHVPTPHWTERVAGALRIVGDQDRSPDLSDGDRLFLSDALGTLTRSITERNAPEQLLHGEPHPGNVLVTANGPLIIDLETCCHGPVELDLAVVPEDVSGRYPDVDRDLLRSCQALALALVTAWRWDRQDAYPNRDEYRGPLLRELRDVIGRLTRLP